jgi:hypothetical protein
MVSKESALIYQAETKRVRGPLASALEDARRSGLIPQE